MHLKDISSSSWFVCAVPCETLIKKSHIRFKFLQFKSQSIKKKANYVNLNVKLTHLRRGIFSVINHIFTGIELVAVVINNFPSCSNILLHSVHSKSTIFSVSEIPDK